MAKANGRGGFALSFHCSEQETELQPGDRITFQRKGKFFVITLHRCPEGKMDICFPVGREHEVSLGLPYSPTAPDQATAFNIAMLIAATHGFGLKQEPLMNKKTIGFRFTM